MIGEIVRLMTSSSGDDEDVHRIFARIEGSSAGASGEPWVVSSSVEVEAGV